MAEIGQTLREARMRAHIDISEVEAKTKIRARYLRAIENEEWDLLPGPVYIKSFLRTYADYLGLDSRMLVDEFKRRYEGPSDHELRPAGSLRRERERDRAPRGPRGPLLPPWAIIGAVLVAVVVALYLIGVHAGSNKPNPTGAQAGTHHHHQTTTTNTGTTSTKPPPRKPKHAKLQLVPTGPVYVCVEKPSGQQLIPGATFAVGQTIPTVTDGLMYVVLGNNAVHMTVNGKTYTVPASAAAIDLKVTPTGVTPVPAGQAIPTCA